MTTPELYITARLISVYLCCCSALSVVIRNYEIVGSAYASVLEPCKCRFYWSLFCLLSQLERCDSFSMDICEIQE